MHKCTYLVTILFQLGALPVIFLTLWFLIYIIMKEINKDNKNQFKRLKKTVSQLDLHQVYNETINLLIEWNIMYTSLY